jgi:hypothetical protein
MKKYYLDENNSGGSFWLTKKDYDNLFANGWKLREGWDADDSFMKPTQPRYGKNDDPTPYGYRHGSVYLEANNTQEVVESFENATGQDFFAQGCGCCGVPFTVHTAYDDPSGYDSISGDDARQSVIRPF